MKPPRFTYHDPVSRDEALALLTTYTDDVKILAGGQSLVPLLNMRLAQPTHLVDINHLAELAYIREQTSGIAIGALTRHRDAERSELVRRHCPLLAAAMPLVGHAPIRSRGTICGSLAHADPAAELPAVLTALDGYVRAESCAGVRILAAKDLFVGELQTALRSDELLTEVWFPTVPARTGAVFLEVCRRHGDFALVGVAAQITLTEQQRIAEARLALVGVAPTPLRDEQSEQLLYGTLPETDIFQKVAAHLASTLKPNSDIHASADYRRRVAITLIERALSRACERAHQNAKDEGRKS